MQGRALPCFFKEKIYGIVIDIIISYAVLDFDGFIRSRNMLLDFS